MNKPFAFWTWNKHGGQPRLAKVKLNKVQRLQRRFAVGGTFAVKTLRSLTIKPTQGGFYDVMRTFRFRKNATPYAKLTNGQIVRLSPR